MILRTKQQVEIRVKSPFFRDDNLKGTLNAGFDIEVVENIEGESVDGNNVWYRDKNGDFLWSGGFENVPEIPATRLTQLIDYRNKFPYLKSDWFTTNGRGIKVGVIDTGFYLDHPDLVHLKTKATITDYGKNGNTDDNDGHGTHVLGLLAANHDSKNLNGLVPEAEFFLYKAYRDNIGYIDSDVADALNDCISRGVDIINMSLDVSTKRQSLLDQAIINALAENILIVASAGDEIELVQKTIAYPARLNNVIAVGEASNPFLERSAQNINKKVNFLLPLEDIKSCWNNGPPGVFYKDLKGSSMGASILTGIIASALSAGISRDEVLTTLQNLCKTFNSTIYTEQSLKIAVL